MAVSPDGANVYVASAFVGSAVAIFARELPVPTTTTTTMTVSTTLPCPSDGFAGLRCVLAPGLGQPACAADSAPKKIGRRLTRAVGVVDRAEAAARPARARRLLGRLGGVLARAARAVDRAEARERLSQGCAVALDAMLADGRDRAARLALALGGG